jgi:hypothetical protein
MADLEAAARHNSDWARQAIADKEAADRERDVLRAEVARFTEWDAANRIEALVEEVDAMRAALSEIERAASPDHWVAQFQHCVDIARQALKGTPNAD